MTDKVLLVVLEDGESFGGAANSRIVEVDAELELEDYGDGWDKVPGELYRELTTIGELLAIVKRLVIAGGQIITADSPDHTVTPTDEDWREFEVALDAAHVATGGDPYFGQCDYCDTTYEVASATDHCPEEGLCWKHCTDREAHEADNLIPGTNRRAIFQPASKYRDAGCNDCGMESHPDHPGDCPSQAEKPLTIIGWANPDGTGRGNWSEVEK